MNTAHGAGLSSNWVGLVSCKDLEAMLYDTVLLIQLVSSGGSLDQLSQAIDRLELPPATYASLIQQCGRAQALEQGRQLHGRIAASAHANDRYLCNLLVQMYGRCGSVGEACTVFRRIQRRNAFSWNIMLAAYAHNGHVQLARGIFNEMPTRDTVSWNQMLGAYVKKGLVQDAKDCFDEIPRPDVVSWTLMVSAYAKCGQYLEAIVLFRLMDLEGVQPDRVMFVIILDACASVTDLELGRIIHASLDYSEESTNLVVRTAVINLYGKCGIVENAKQVFDTSFSAFQGETQQAIAIWNAMAAAYAQNGRVPDAVNLFSAMPARDVISWNTVIAAFAQNEMETSALETFSLMDLEGVPPNEVTFIAVIDACSKLGCRDRARIVHSAVNWCGFHTDVRVGNALLNMHGKCESLELAEDVFRTMPEKNVITWTALISAYSQNRRCKEALAVYRGMIHQGIRPNAVTLLGAIDACAGSAASADAATIHRTVKEFSTDLDKDPVIGNAIINMHGKCGNLAAAMAAFATLGPGRNAISWNTVIGAHAHAGNAQQAIELYRDMVLDGAAPLNTGCFTSLLSACNNAGLLSCACEYFASMVCDYEIAPLTEHYHCMIDLLGRAGRVAEVAELIESMPCKPDVIAWTAFVDACKTQGEVEVAKVAAVTKLTPPNSGPYALLSNLYALQEAR